MNVDAIYKYGWFFLGITLIIASAGGMLRAGGVNEVFAIVIPLFVIFLAGQCGLLVAKQSVTRQVTNISDDPKILFLLFLSLMVALLVGNGLSKTDLLFAPIVWLVIGFWLVAKNTYTLFSTTVTPETQHA